LKTTEILWQAFFTVFLILPANGFPRFLSLGKKILEFRGKILEFRVKILSLETKNVKNLAFLPNFSENCRIF